MAGKNTVQRVEEIAGPIAEAMNYRIWDITFTKEGTDWYLRVFIDKDGGISIDDCVDFTRAITRPIDEADPISQSYMLEVSSPGVERELKRDRHFEAYIGSPVMARTIRPVDNVRDFSGTLESYENGEITIRLRDDKIISFNKKDCSYVKLDDFDI